MTTRSLGRRGGLVAALVVIASLTVNGSIASAAEADVDLGTADNFAVLAGAGITNTGPTTITGDVGTFPTTTQSGFGSVTLTGTNHAGDAVTQQAKIDLVTAYNDAAGRGPTTQIATDLAGQTLAPGVYDSASGTFGNSGILTLDGQNQTNPVFIFEMSSTLITSSGSAVNLINGADACNVYWRVGSSATLGTGSSLRGTILALTTITLTTGATLEGRALARNGAVTLDTNTITRASCAASTTTTDTTITSAPNPSLAGEPVTLTATVTATNGTTPTGDVQFFDDGESLGTAPLVNGQATVTTAALGPGEHDITAVYLGAPGFSSSESTGITQTVVAVPVVPVVPVVPAVPVTDVPRFTG
jgi:hypothetical protein